MLKTYPIKTIKLPEAIQFQFRFIDSVTKEFKGSEVLNNGDLGVVQPKNMPTQTAKAERVIARFFDAEDAMLVRGAGTNAIRLSLYSFLNPGDTILLHDAPVYPTTKTTLKYMNLNMIYVDFNDIGALKKVLEENKNIKGSLVQFSRQKIDDKYDIGKVISTIKSINSKIKIVTDDNYVAFKVKEIGSQLGSDLSTFSAFKLLGPEGVGVVVGKKALITKIRKMNYSGGSQVQGFEAMDVLRAFAYVPVSLAIQSKEIDELHKKLNSNIIKEIDYAVTANAQSKVVIVKFKKPIAQEIIKKCEKYGAAPNPVGAESKYEITPMIYRVSATFSDSIKDSDKYLIRINPMRASHETVIEILKSALEG